MATYKVIQDIEAEDKLVGPLSFRQFVYMLIAAFLGFVSFTVTTNGAAFLLVFLLPPMIFCLFFAFPWTPDQPTEVWALARIRFLVKARKRIWDQSGVKEFVTVTVPKKIERHYTDGLSQTEVRSRLQALANTIDSRGWAVKNAGSSPQRMIHAQVTDRLLGFDAMPQQVTDYSYRASDDIMDNTNNPAAYHMGQMIDASSKAHRQMLMDKLRQQGATPPVTPAPPAWFAPSQTQGPTAPPVQVQPTATPAVSPIAVDTALVAQPITDPMSQPELIAIEAEVPKPQEEPIIRQADPAILNLAHDNNLDVATLAREAKRAKDLEASGDEVVVSLR